MRSSSSPSGTIPRFGPRFCGTGFGPVARRQAAYMLERATSHTRATRCTP
jgi:hypothetical protein